VKERTKEIGTMKAIGFTSKAIMFQIMMEGFMIAVISGFIGIFMGYVGSPIITEMVMPESASGSSSQISVLMMVIGFLFMVFLGSVGSIYPAWVASRKSPVEAMSHE
jgi:putative ABC transport system permease protein